MSLTCTVAALGFAIGYALFLHGLISLVEHLNALAVCRRCVGICAVEAGGGVVILAGLLMMTGGFL